MTSIVVLLTARGNSDIECRMLAVSVPEESNRCRLEERLREVDERLRSEMRARGFDPAQDDNVALTAPLAELYIERENLRTALQSLIEKEKPLSE